MFTDLRRFEGDQAALRTTLLEQKAILENAAVGIMLSKDRTIKECNIRAAEMFGYAVDELLGMSSVCIFPSGLAYEEMGRDASPALARGEAYTSELQLRRKDGNLLWCRLYGRAVDASNAEHGTIWIIEDIDEPHHNEAKLRRALLEMQAIMDNAPLAIAFLRDHKVMRYNHQFASMFGFSEDSGVGIAASELYVPDGGFETMLAGALPCCAAAVRIRPTSACSAGTAAVSGPTPICMRSTRGANGWTRSGSWTTAPAQKRRKRRPARSCSNRRRFSTTRRSASCSARAGS
ncbi:PAS domain S-box protein [Massilia sp. B-10]|nr:PAS domain S-box protein [Massilia sp. B-10]